MLIRLLVVALAQLCLALPAFAQASFLVFEDPTGTKSAAEVMANPQWFEESRDPSRGFSKSTFWLKVAVQNRTPKQIERDVLFKSTQLPSVIEYSTESGAIQVRKSGYLIPQSEREVSTIAVVFPHHVAPESTIEVFYQIRSPLPINLDYEILSRADAAFATSLIDLLHISPFVALLVLWLFNFFVFLTSRDKLYGVYSIFLLCHLAFVGGQTRVWEWAGLVVNSPEVTAYAATMTHLALLWFWNLVFKAERSRLVRIISWGLAGILLIHAALPPFTQLHLYANYTGPIIFAGLTFLIAHAWYKGNAVAKWMMLGWLINFACGLAFFAHTQGSLTVEFEQIGTLGILIESILFALVLSYRVQLLNRTEELAAQLAQKNEKQKEMFSIIGHELRTPVSAISMLAADASLTQDDKIDQIRDISDNLLHVLEDLRVVVAPERALLAKKELSDPVRILKRALSPLQQLVKERGLTLVLDVSIPEGRSFSFSSQQLRQCVTNLVKNAVIHSGGTHIYLQYNEVESSLEEVQCHIKIEDNGKGVAPELQSKVFEAFGRGDTSEDGTGLGLFIVKQLAEQMSGQLTYSKSQHGGACFDLVFPMTIVDTEPQPQRPSISLENMRILLTEDDAMLRMLTERLLKNRGAQVTSFENAYLALQQFDEKDYDLVLTDLMMPKMNGHEFTKTLRQRGVRLPIIGVTAAVMGEETSDWLNDGASGFIAKPITAEKLVSALGTLNKGLGGAKA